MKRSLSKTSSTPEQLPRISFRKKTSSKRQPESKSRHYPHLDMSPWRPLTGVDTMALPVVFHSRTAQTDRGRPSETQGSLSDRSLPIRRASDVPFTQGMVTILHRDDEADDDDTYTPTRLYDYDDQNIREGSPVPAHLHQSIHSHSNGLELGSCVDSGSGITPNLGRFHHSKEGKNHLHIRVPGNEVPRRSPAPVHSHTHSHCHGLELGTYVNSGLGISHTLGHFHHREERKNHHLLDVKDVPRRRPVPVQPHSHSHCHGLEVGTCVNSGLGINHSLGHFHAGPRPRQVSFARPTHRPRHIKIRIGPPRTPAVSPTGDLGVPVHLGDLGQRGDLPSPRSSVRESGEQETYIHSRSLRDVQPEDEQKCQNDDAKPELTCPGLTQEVLTSGLYSDSEQREDRVSDWLEECDCELTPASLPPHLPEIDGQRRCKPSSG